MIDLQGITKSYDDFVAVDNLSLSVNVGEMLVLVGGSGSGKTTTLKMINRLIDPTRGKVLLDGEDITILPHHALRRRIGYVFQGVGLFPHMTVAENIGITPSLLKWDKQRISKKVEELLVLVDLDPDTVRERFPAELSGGQQQRVGVARALAAEPRVMLFDEPFGALDQLTRDHLQQSLLKIRKNLRLTAVFVTHDIVEAMVLGDRIAVLEGGKLMQVGKPQDLMNNPTGPYVEQLMETQKAQAQFVGEIVDDDARIEAGSMSEQLARLPDLLTAHLQLALVAIGIGILVSIPLGVVATRVNWLKRLSVGLASIVQTIPGLALLAIVVPLLTFLGVQDFGYLPAIIALTLYSILPILRNTVTGIDNLDPAFIEAARGVGMTLWQQIRMVELPLAMPVIIAGIRTSTVWVVGIATLSTAVGAPSLGNYIFEGLHIRNTTAVLIGCVAAASLALILDGLVHALAVGIQKRLKKLVAAVLTVFGLLYSYTGYTLARDALSGADDPVVIGSKGFTEQYILSEILAGWIKQETGLPVSQRKSLGSTVAFDALHSGSIDVYIDYSGTIWATIMKRDEVPDDPSRVTRQVKNFLKESYDIHQVGAFGFENAYSLAVRSSDSSILHLENISDLTLHASQMVIGGDYEFFGRPEWAAIKDAYGFEFQKTVPMDPSLMYTAVANRNVDVISAFTTDGRITAFNLTVLQDDRNAIPPYDALILVRSGLLEERPNVVDALGELIGTIGVKRMRKMNQAVDDLGHSPAQVAGRFLGGL